MLRRITDKRFLVKPWTQKAGVFVVLRLEAVEEVVVRRHNLLLLLLSGLQRAELRTGVGALN